MEFELNAMQLSLWRAWRGFKERPMNHRSMKIEWRVVLDVEAFKLAAQDLVDSTDALRLRFVERDGAPYQYAAKACDPCLVIQDFSDHDCPADAAVDWLTGLEIAPFDLETKAFSMALAKVADDHWIWLLNQHHVITDHTSSANLIKKLSSFYGLRQNGDAPDIGADASFLDFHQRTHTTQSRITFDGARPARLHPALANTAPQRVHPKPLDQTEFHLGKDRLARFRSARGLSRNGTGARFQACLYELMLAATFAFIYRVSGQASTTIGTMSHGRFSPESTDIIGPLVRVLPMTIGVQGDWSCAQMMTEVAAGRKSVFRAVRRGKDIQGAPFNASVNFIPETMPDFCGVRSIEITKARLIEDVSRDVSITIRAADTPGDIKCLFNLNHEVTDLVPMGNLQAVYLAVLDAFIDAPDCTIDDIAIFSMADVATEMARSERAMNAPVLPHISLVEGILKQVEQSPQATAVIAGDTTLTFEQLEQKSRAIACALMACGIGAGDVVALRLPRSEQLIITLLGILRAGATYFALDMRHPAQRRAFMLNDCSAQMLIVPKGADLDPSEAGFPMTDPELLLDAGKALDLDLPQIDPAAVMYIMYTSGTTGTPKGVQVPHDSFARYHHWASGVLSAGKPITWALATTVSFETAFRAFMPLTTGGAVVLYETPSDVAGMSIIAALEDDRVDGMALTPSQLRSLCDRNWQLDRLKTLVIIGEVFPTELALRAQQVFGPAVKLYNFYGPTEATMATTLHLFDPTQDTGASVPIGPAGPGAAVHILDSQLQPVPQGLVGEICIAGTRLSKGYLNRGDLTVQKFMPDPFRKGGLMYRTGDLGRYTKTGNLVHHGRCDDQVKINGVRIELGEIEAALAGHGEVDKCAVIVADATGNGSSYQLVAFCVSKRDVPASELRNCCAAVLARDCIPKVFVRINAIPLARNGKMDRQALLAHFVQNPIRNAQSDGTETGPIGPTEQKIGAIWQRVLNVDKISRTDDFFDIGGDSLSFLQMILMVEAECCVSLSAVALDGVVSLAQMGALTDGLMAAGLMAAGLMAARLPDQQKPSLVAKKVPQLAQAGTPLAEVSRQLRLGSVAWKGVQVGGDLPVLSYNTAGPKPPLFWCFNGAKEPATMAQHLGEDQPLFAMRSLQGVIERGHKADYLEEIARGYVDEIITLQPAGPYYVGGNCQSGEIAEQIAHELLSRGHQVGHLFLLEHTPKRRLGVGVSLFFGRESNDFNPFLKEAQPQVQWKSLFPTVTWDIVPGTHGQYFQPHIAPVFIGRLFDRLSVAQGSTAPAEQTV